MNASKKTKTKISWFGTVFLFLDTYVSKATNKSIDISFFSNGSRHGPGKTINERNNKNSGRKNMRELLI